jgi:hypothetical protein
MLNFNHSQLLSNHIHYNICYLFKLSWILFYDCYWVYVIVRDSILITKLDNLMMLMNSFIRKRYKIKWNITLRNRVQVTILTTTWMKSAWVNEVYEKRLVVVEHKFTHVIRTTSSRKKIAFQLFCKFQVLSL